MVVQQKLQWGEEGAVGARAPSTTTGVHQAIRNTAGLEVRVEELDAQMITIVRQVFTARSIRLLPAVALGALQILRSIRWVTLEVMVEDPEKQTRIIPRLFIGVRMVEVVLGKKEEQVV